MNNLPTVKVMYRALVNKDVTFEGIFYAGVKTTGIFCRPTCPAKKPDMKNVEFFASAKNALLAGFKPCKRCHPMQPLGKAPEWIAGLLKEVSENNSIRWKDSDLRVRNYDPISVRRWFKKNHNITFHAYVRSLRLGNAIGRLKNGDNLTQTAFNHGYESLSGFRDAIKKITGMTAGKAGNSTIVYLNRILTPLGPMLAGATNEGICLLEFLDRRMLGTQLRILIKRLNCNFVPGSNEVIESLSGELKEYFNGNLKQFKTPVIFPGTTFQMRVWKNLINIPSGTTISYEHLAGQIGQPAAVRAVASANGANRIAIVIPCHRVIGKDGNLTGYGGGLWRKKFLIELEKGSY